MRIGILVAPIMAIAAAGCGPGDDVRTSGPRLTAEPQYLTNGKTADLELVFDDAPDLGEGCASWYKILDFGPGIGHEYQTKLPGCTGIRVRVIVAADAELGRRAVRLEMIRAADGEWDGAADLWIVPE